MTDYQQPRCPHGWVDVTQCESCAQAAEIDALRQRVKELEADRDQYRMMWLREKEENDLRGGNGEAESRPRP